MLRTSISVSDGIMLLAFEVVVCGTVEVVFLACVHIR